MNKLLSTGATVCVPCPPVGYVPILSVGTSMCIQPVSGQSKALVVMETCGCTTLLNWKLSLYSSNQYQIVNQQSGLCLNVPASATTPGTQLITYPCSPASTNALFTLAYVNSAWTITQVNSQLVLDVQGAALSSGTALDQQTANGGLTQQWLFAQGIWIYHLISICKVTLQCLGLAATKYVSGLLCVMLSHC